MYIDDRKKTNTDNDNRLNQSQPQNLENQVNFDDLMPEQKDRLFKEYGLVPQNI